MKSSFPIFNTWCFFFTEKFLGETFVCSFWKKELLYTFDGLFFSFNPKCGYHLVKHCEGSDLDVRVLCHHNDLLLFTVEMGTEILTLFDETATHYSKKLVYHFVGYCMIHEYLYCRFMYCIKTNADSSKGYRFSTVAFSRQENKDASINGVFKQATNLSGKIYDEHKFMFVVFGIMH